MTLSELYLEAARMIAEREENYCCLAIDDLCNDPAAEVGDDVISTAEPLFDAMFRPEYLFEGGPWFSSIYTSPDPEQQQRNKQEARDHRVISLCLMAAMVEDAEQRLCPRCNQLPHYPQSTCHDGDGLPSLGEPT